MWTAIYLAQSKEKASQIQIELEKAGILVRIQASSKLEKSNDFFEVFVPETDVEGAHNISMEKEL